MLVVAGSLGMAGAAVLCARGALRTGAGLVQVSVPQELYPVIHAGVVEATCVSRRADDLDLDGYQAIAIGPGLGVRSEHKTLIERVLTEYGGTVVADADALNERKKREPCEALLSEFQQEKARENTEFLSVLREGNPERFAEEGAACSTRDASDS